ncbi:dihydrodipicolinate synthase [Psychromonas sp. CNPT3]|uniref:4-hydroxy-tetrahydrodipicolinate synthase n=1 Tax=Psychromonas sp. CNPT3 TaxID=314282 RepID=UPI00006E34E7|nr:4-hydroxy-tetrahydrodipicolinate synthase [Psychromonas sp. CNPT3]AGH81203.1 dihydrodipicolinate synthase [Psychromonas sp. CNPT3]
MLTGCIVALVTPMQESGEIDFIALRKLVEFHIKAGTAAIVSMGTTGESATLSCDEHIKVVLKTLEYAAGRIDVIAGNGANSTAVAIEMSQRLENSGIVAGLNVTPYYNKPTQEGLYQHFKHIAQSSKLPQILYNVPARTAVDLLPETIGRLAKIDNIIGIKEATGDLSRLLSIKKLVPENFLLYSGDDATCCDFMLQGGDGVISVSCNIAPQLMNTMSQLAISGDTKAALKINAQLIPLYDTLFIEANPIPVKWACAKLGLISSADCRLPLTILDVKYQQTLENALTEVKLIS